MANGLQFNGVSTLPARAVVVADRIDARALRQRPVLAVGPLTVAVGEGCAVLFRYGVVVFFNVVAAQEQEFLDSLKSFLFEPCTDISVESAEFTIDRSLGEGEGSTTIALHGFDLYRLQLVADMLARSAELSLYESRIRDVFERVEPLARHLMEQGRSGRSGRELLKFIGQILLIQQKMVGGVEVSEKPEILWEHPELERLFLRLEDEYELRERHKALEDKLALVSRTASTSLDLLQHTRSMRVEWYIVLLIMIDIVVSLWKG